MGDASRANELSGGVVQALEAQRPRDGVGGARRIYDSCRIGNAGSAHLVVIEYLVEGQEHVGDGLIHRCRSVRQADELRGRNDERCRFDTHCRRKSKRRRRLQVLREAQRIGEAHIKPQMLAKMVVVRRKAGGRGAIAVGRADGHLRFLQDFEIQPLELERRCWNGAGEAAVEIA